MNRLASILAASLLLAACSAGSADVGADGGGGDDAPDARDGNDLPRDVTVLVDISDLGRSLDPELIGLSMEYPMLGPCFGRLEKLNDKFVQLLVNLGVGTVRLGGSSTDTSCWRVSPDADLPAGCQMEISSNALKVVAKAMGQSGWRAMLGVDLAHYSPSTALDFARDGVALAFAGDLRGHLLGLEFGNEPNLYGLQGRRPTGYSQDDFVGEWSAYADAIRGNASTDWVAAVGPAYGARSSWFTDLKDFTLGVGDRLGGVVAIHDYPLSSCNAGTRTIEELLADDTNDTSMKKATQGAEMAAAVGADLEIDQANSISCDGQDGVSNRFAAALWGLDYLLGMAKAGAARINLHMVPNAYFNPIQSSELGPPPYTYNTRVTPLYYAMLLASRAASGRLLDARVTDGAFALSAYAVRASDGSVLVYLDNKDMKAGGTVAVTTSDVRGDATAITLKAPSLSSSVEDVTLGGQKVDTATGSIAEPQTEAVPLAAPDGTYLVHVPNASAVLLIIPEAP